MVMVLANINSSLSSAASAEIHPYYGDSTQVETLNSTTNCRLNGQLQRFVSSSSTGHRNCVNATRAKTRLKKHETDHWDYFHASPRCQEFTRRCSIDRAEEVNSGKLTSQRWHEDKVIIPEQLVNNTIIIMVVARLVVDLHLLKYLSTTSSIGSWPNISNDHGMSRHPVNFDTVQLKSTDFKYAVELGFELFLELHYSTRAN